MKLYAMATMSQDGNELMIEIMGENRQLLARTKVTKPPMNRLDPQDYILEVFPVAYPDILKIDVKGHGYKLVRKEEAQRRGRCKEHGLYNCSNCS